MTEMQPRDAPPGPAKTVTVMADGAPVRRMPKGYAQAAHKTKLGEKLQVVDTKGWVPLLDCGW